ncbi:peptidoglycan-binding domain-containing protein [Oscillatoria sp. FACHB-1406]|uniref:peptidoglycan-binding domain-containing protein n=1 Tax=Oscillatoria sp. FACHB-1406 TaxID=2692846 RepID=UPI001686FB0F|nr:peptidoglycan-binding domain-containing protein [Oscillatoria sp. FACHB-1406]MBD2580174.1 peptidoglycan-binding protein [Oscillatoria sp. FACHB-1406]
MEALAYTQACESYEQDMGIEYDLPEFDLDLKALPSSAGLGTAAIALAAAALTTASPASAARVNTPNGGCLHARTGPGSEYTSVKCVRDGAELLPVVARQGSWVKLSSGRWVYGPYTTAGGSSSGGSGTVVLTPGSRGSKVSSVQKKLFQLGYNIGPTGVDGTYGFVTTQAVKSFQSKNGLRIDGIAGPRTLQAMGLG